MLRRRNYGCSLAFTGRHTNGGRWAITAGHCTGLNTPWGHYGTPIGPARFVSNPYDGGGGSDSALIRMDNATWRDAAGGYQYHGTNSTHIHDVDVAVNFMAVIEVGDEVCFNGWHTGEGPRHCGIVDIVSDGTAYGLTRVRGYATCFGDSGGAVLFTIAGSYWAYGIASGSNDGPCPPNGGSGYYTWFEPLPRAHAAWGGVSVETR